MFTGIIQATTEVISAKRMGNIVRARIKKPVSWRLSLGQSIAVDGICSTVTRRGKDSFEVEYMAETLSKTTARDFAPGKPVNLERSLTIDSPIDGHVVQGHVDARAKVLSVRDDGASRRIRVGIPAAVLPFVVERGSVALNGVSLTVAQLHADTATVALIPHTLAHTDLRFLKPGDEVNIEADILARYVIAAQERNDRVGHAKKALRKGRGTP